jgi:hypothetical protein
MDKFVNQVNAASFDRAAELPIGRERRRMKKRNTMATENDNDEVVLTYNESYYEELASAEEIYLEVTEEELRSKLISDTPHDDRPTSPLDAAFESYREVLVNLLPE